MLIGIVAAAISGIGHLKGIAESSSKMLEAEWKAQKCGIAADLLFANGGGKLQIMENCYGGSKHEVRAVVQGIEKSAFSVAEKVSSSQAGGATMLEVEIDAHYR